MWRQTLFSSILSLIFHCFVFERHVRKNAWVCSMWPILHYSNLMLTIYNQNDEDETKRSSPAKLRDGAKMPKETPADLTYIKTFAMVYMIIRMSIQPLSLLYGAGQVYWEAVFSFSKSVFSFSKSVLYLSKTGRRKSMLRASAKSSQLTNRPGQRLSYAWRRSIGERFDFWIEEGLKTNSVWGQDKLLASALSVNKARSELSVSWNWFPITELYCEAASSDIRHPAKNVCWTRLRRVGIDGWTITRADTILGDPWRFWLNGCSQSPSWWTPRCLTGVNLIRLIFFWRRVHLTRWRW